MYGRFNCIEKCNEAGRMIHIVILLTLCLLFERSADVAAAENAGSIRKLGRCSAVIDGAVYNLESLQTKSEQPRFTFQDGVWNFSFSPCASYNLPIDPHDGLGDQCQFVAVCKWRTVVSGGEYFTYGIHLTSKFQMLSLPMLHDVSVSNTGRGKFKPHLPSSENSTNQPHPDDATSGQVGGSRNDSRAVSGKYKPEVTTKIPFGSKFRAAVVFQGIRSFKHMKTIIRLICTKSRSKPEDALFKKIESEEEDEVHFELHHRCCCPNGCLTTSSWQQPAVNGSVNKSNALEPSMTVPSDSFNLPKQYSSEVGDVEIKDQPPKFLWLILLINFAILVVAIFVAGVCCKRSGANTVASGPYNYLPALHSSQRSLDKHGNFDVQVLRGSTTVLSGRNPTSGQTKLTSPDYRDYTTAASRSAKPPMLVNCVIPSDQLDVGQRLGGGLFGDTYLSEWKNRQVAAKRITVRIHQNQQNMSTSDNDWIISQISNLSKQRHQNLVAILGICVDARQPYVINEFIDGESLKDLLARDGDKLSWHQKIKMCIQTTDGMAFLHSAKYPILHRDLRSANILVEFNGKAKIVDFGLIRIMQRLRNECNSTKNCYCQKETSAFPASIRWTAPEILRYPKAEEASLVASRSSSSFTAEVFTTGCDVYSFAMVLWEVATGADPFEDISEEGRVAEMVLEGARPSCEDKRIPLPHYRELMKICWDQMVERRPNFRQIAVHLKTILQIFNKVSQTYRRDRSDSMHDSVTNYLKSTLNVTAE